METFGGISRGNKLMVRQDISTHMPGVVSEMVEFAGHEVTVAHVFTHKRAIYIEEDEREWYWYPHCFAEYIHSYEGCTADFDLPEIESCMDELWGDLK